MPTGSPSARARSGGEAPHRYAYALRVAQETFPHTRAAQTPIAWPPIERTPAGVAGRLGARPPLLGTRAIQGGAQVSQAS
jgi:hypothetical protein